MQADLAAYDARHRAECDRCNRPESECYCATLVALTPRTRVLLLQHPRERSVAIGTAKMTHLGLTNSLLRYGVCFDDDKVVQQALASPTTALLFPAADLSGVDEPGEQRTQDATVDEWTPAPPSTLIVIDGTWSQARKMIRENPRLLDLPRVGLRPSAPGNYRIRREPNESFLSTVEAVSQTLQVWEGDDYAALLRPFDFLVSRQVQAKADHTPSRYTRRPRQTPTNKAMPELFRFVYKRSRPVVIYVEANRHPRESRPAGAPEVVHLVASFLPDEGAVPANAPPGVTLASPPPTRALDIVVAPRRPTSTFLPDQLGLSPHALENGASPDGVRDALTQMMADERSTVCFWGLSARDALAVDITKFGRFVDVRALAARSLGRSAGGLPSAHAAICGPSKAPPSTTPRAVSFQRLVVEILATLVARARADAEAAATPG